MKKNKYWAVYDEQTHNYLHSGRNTKSLKRAVDEVWSFWIGGADLEPSDAKKVGKWGWKQKKNWLENTQGFRFEKITKKLSEDVL